MDFWGVEVKPYEHESILVAENKILHITNVTLGKVKEDHETPRNIPVKINYKGNQSVVANLSYTIRNVSFDLMFPQSLVVLHGWKHGSVHLSGYTENNPIKDVDYDAREIHTYSMCVDPKEQDQADIEAERKAEKKAHKKASYEAKNKAKYEAMAKENFEFGNFDKAEKIANKKKYRHQINKLDRELLLKTGKSRKKLKIPEYRETGFKFQT